MIVKVLAWFLYVSADRLRSLWLCSRLCRRQLWGCALPVKYSSINRHSAINFCLSVLIYPVMALGCFAMSNVLWRWAFHILYRFSLLLFLPPSTKKLRSHFCEIKPQSERRGGGKKWEWGWGGGKQWNLTRLKLYHFQSIPQGAGYLSAGLEKQRSPDW